MNKHNTSSKCSFSGGEFTACLLWCHIFQHDSLTLVKDHLSSRATTADNLRHGKATLMYVAGSRRALEEIQPFCGKAVNLQPAAVICLPTESDKCEPLWIGKGWERARWCPATALALKPVRIDCFFKTSGSWSPHRTNIWPPKAQP